MTKILFAALSFTVSALQAWDSGALTAEGPILLLIAAGVLLPAVTIAASQSAVTRLVAAAVSIAIFVAARLLSQMHLPELALAGVFPAILILASQMWPPVRRSAA